MKTVDAKDLDLACLTDEFEDDDELHDTVPYDESFGEIVVADGGAGRIIYMPERFALRDDLNVPQHEDEDGGPAVPLITVQWEGLQPDYSELTREHALCLAMALIEAVKGM